MSWTMEDNKSVLRIISSFVIMGIGAIIPNWVLVCVGSLMFVYSTIKIPVPLFCGACRSEDVYLVFDRETTEIQQHYKCRNCGNGFVQLESVWQQWKRERNDPNIKSR